MQKCHAYYIQWTLSIIFNLRIFYLQCNIKYIKDINPLHMFRLYWTNCYAAEKGHLDIIKRYVRMNWNEFILKKNPEMYQTLEWNIWFHVLFGQSWDQYLFFGFSKRHLEPHFVFWKENPVSWVTWFFPSLERNNCLQSWANSQNDTTFHSNDIQGLFWVKIVVILLSSANNHFKIEKVNIFLSFSCER